ncbi:MAG: L-aspartate oxidase [Nocardioides sp.]|uniref:L-aspartate oxidase n=1 Tax=Nocardioides sp. TaxID=35761 RepID=UPI0039E663E2
MNAASRPTTERETDVLVLGAGVAGLTVARAVAGARRVLLVEAGPGSTATAQGGIAAAIDAEDDPRQHAADTSVAGAGVCDEDAVTALTEDGPVAIAGLVRAGAQFDRGPDGRLALGLEGGHHRRRIVHAGGDATGAEVHRALSGSLTGVERLRGSAVTLTLGIGALGIGTHGRQVTGAVVRTPEGDVVVRARATVLATGGLGHVYARTTNPVGVDGSGLALALAAGANLVDMEFVQFHPTALATGAASGQLPLVSEAVRGEGAVLLDADGRRFMLGRHPLADLAPRDIVAREITKVAAETGSAHVWLDARPIGRALPARFPTFVASCATLGLDPADDLVPVAPAEHYLCGGVATDRWGATNVPGLYAVGEVAATGIHGANRLASNSLLEGLVFGRRLADRLVLELPDRAPHELTVGIPQRDPSAAALVPGLLAEHAGVVRDAVGLDLATAALAALPVDDPLAQVGRAVLAAATARTESRGAHFRTDHPATDPGWVRRVPVRLDEDGLPRADLTRAEECAA